MKHVDRFVAIGPRSKQIFEANGVDPYQSTVIPLCANPDFESEGSSINSDDTFRLLYVGQLLELKGVDVLIEAVDRVDDDIIVDIVGDGPQKSNLENQVDRLELGDRVIFHGYVPNQEVPAFYEAADVFVHPSRFPDPGTRTIVEALQKLTPAIVSDSGDPPWVVGEAGCTFENENPRALAEIIQELKQDDQRLTALKQACKERRNEFTAHAAQEKFEKLYWTVVAPSSKETTNYL
jgi:glycosyltransferase involved in cell wall biosynthesis